MTTGALRRFCRHFAHDRLLGAAGSSRKGYACDAGQTAYDPFEYGGLRVRRFIAAAIAVFTVSVDTAYATSGPGCLIVVNVASNDALNMRARPSSASPIVDILVPRLHGIIHLDQACRPRSAPWGQRWCKVSHYNGDRVTQGWVKARYVRDSDCP